MEQFITGTIAPLIQSRRWSAICEIGSSLGLGTDRLLSVPGVRVTIVDPCIDTDLGAKYTASETVNVLRGFSLEVLEGLNAAFDCILIDGDHNWYTVHEELEIIRRRSLLKLGGAIFLDDVDWPYGLRDMYYQPERIPENFRHPYERKGMIRGRSPLSECEGLNAHLFNARFEGGPRNGVFTAIKDFLNAHPGEYRFSRICLDSGLGVMIGKSTLSQDIWFEDLSLRHGIYNSMTWPKRQMRKRLPNAYRLMKSALGMAVVRG